MKRIRPILNTNLHFIWVILFFTIHGYNKYYHLVPIGALLILLGELLLAGTVLFWINTMLFRDKRKSGIFTSLILAVTLFFGAFQDFFAGIEILSVLSYLRLLIIICLVGLVAVYLLLKKAKLNFRKAIMYLNSLLIIYLLIDICSIFSQLFFPSAVSEKTFKQFKVSDCDSCKTPSVYLILMDEYLGSHGLKEYFDYNNGNFEKFLTDQGFKVIRNPTSNYQLTLFSMASLLNMNYIPQFEELQLSNHYVYKKLLSLLKNNVVCEVFQENGYKVVNLSNFEIQNAPGLDSPSELPQKIELITNQTMINRIGKYLPVWLAEMHLAKFQEKQAVALATVNDETIEKALQEGKKDNRSPVFVYVHLMMPHLPYVYDSLGKVNPSFHQKHLAGSTSDSDYLQYLVYTNRRISQFIGELQKATHNNAVILLMSDHGYRDGARRNSKFAYQTFNAVYLPTHNYNDWYDGMSNVNQFPILFNSVFGQRIQILKDSIVQQAK